MRRGFTHGPTAAAAELPADEASGPQAQAHASAAAAVHRLYRRLKWTRCRGVAARARLVAEVATRPARSAVRAVNGARIYGRKVAQATGVPVHRQLVHQWAVCARFGFDTDTYYRYRMYELEGIGGAAMFLPIDENMAIRAYLYDTIGVDPDGLADKRNFYRTCIRHGLPVPRTVADFEDGHVTWWPGTEPGELPPLDLFSKEARNIKGRGAARWVWQGDGCYRDEAGASVTGAQVIERFRDSSRAAPFILQVRLANHARIEQLAPSTLCTIRIVTFHAAGGEPVHLDSAFRVAGRSSAVDNFSQGGLACPVLAGTGELLPGVLKDLHLTMVRHDVHPATGSQVRGFRLPGWHRALDLTLRAHRVFYEYPSIGWDVALTPDGPVLVEANYNWNAATTQQASGRPLGANGYFESVLSYLDRGFPSAGHGRGAR